MTAAGGVYAAACLLLAAAGVAKVRQPAATVRALAGVLGWPAVPRRGVQAGGGAEVALAAVALLTGRPGPAVAVGLCYLGFAAFVVVSVARGGEGAGCGCFGDAAADVALGPLHAAVNLAMAGAAGAVAVAGGLGATGPERAALSVAAASLAWATYLVLVPLPRLLAVVREPLR